MHQPRPQPPECGLLPPSYDPTLPGAPESRRSTPSALREPTATAAEHPESADASMGQDDQRALSALSRGARPCGPRLLPSPPAHPSSPIPDSWQLHFPPSLHTPRGQPCAAAPSPTAAWAPRPEPGDGTQALPWSEPGTQGGPPPVHLPAPPGTRASGESGLVDPYARGPNEEGAAAPAPSQSADLRAPPHSSHMPKAPEDTALALPLLSWQPGGTFPGAPLPALPSLNPPPNHPLSQVPPGIKPGAPPMGPALPLFSTLPRPCVSGVAGLPRGPVMHPRLVSTLRDLICGTHEALPGEEAQAQAQAEAEATTPGTPGSALRPLTPPLIGPSAPEPTLGGAPGNQNPAETRGRGTPGAQGRDTPVPCARAPLRATTECGRGNKGSGVGGPSRSPRSNSDGSSSGEAVAPLEALASNRSYSVGTASVLASPVHPPGRRLEDPSSLSPSALPSRSAHTRHLVDYWHQWRARNSGTAPSPGEGQGSGTTPRPLVAPAPQAEHSPPSPMLPVGRSLFPSLEAAASAGTSSGGKGAPEAASSRAHRDRSGGPGGKGITLLMEMGAQEGGARALSLLEDVSPSATRASPQQAPGPCWDTLCVLHADPDMGAPSPLPSYTFGAPAHGTPREHHGSFPRGVAAPLSPDSASLEPCSPCGAPQGGHEGHLSLPASPSVGQARRRLLPRFPGFEGVRLAPEPPQSPLGAQKLAPGPPGAAPSKAVASAARQDELGAQGPLSPLLLREGVTPLDSLSAKNRPGHPATPAPQLSQQGLSGSAPQGWGGRLRLRRGRDEGTPLGSPIGSSSPVGSGLSTGQREAHRGPSGSNGGQASQLVTSPGADRGAQDRGALGSRSPGGKSGGSKKSPSCCPECGRMFVGLYELRRHFGRKHMQGEKPFACAKCAKRFFVEADLRDHERACGTLLTCLCCGLHFAFKCNLNHHIRGKPACSAFYEDLRAQDAAGSAPGHSEGVRAQGEGRPIEQRRADAGLVTGHAQQADRGQGYSSPQAARSQAGLGLGTGSGSREKASTGVECKDAAEAALWGRPWGSPGQEVPPCPSLGAPQSSGQTMPLESTSALGRGAWRVQSRGQKRPLSCSGMVDSVGDGRTAMQDLQQNKPARGTRQLFAMKR